MTFSFIANLAFHAIAASADDDAIVHPFAQDEKMAEHRTRSLGQLAESAYSSGGMTSADDARMDDAPVPETLQTIAASIAALRKSMDQRFEETNAQVEALGTSMDHRFEETNAQVGVKIEALRKSMDQRFDETKAQLGVKIEAVDARVTLVLDAVISLRELAKANTKDHQRFTDRLDDHDIRILALGPPRPASL